jgi:hypothetical protein
MDYERNGCCVMNILIDIFLLLLIVLVVAGAARKNTARAAIRLAAVTAAAAGMLLAPYPAPAAAPFFAASVQNSAAADLAKLANTPVLGSAEETLGKIDLIQLQQKQPEKFAAVVQSYGVDYNKLLQAAGEENAPAKEAVLLGEPLSKALAQACCGAAVMLALLLIVLSVLNALFRRQRKSKEKQKVTAGSAVIGILTGLVAAAFIAVPLFEVFRPFSAGVLGTMQWDVSCGKSVLYRLLQWCNPLV